MAGRHSMHRAAFHVRKGNFHRWLGKKPSAPITAADISKGKNSDNPHVVKMATFADNAKHWNHKK